MYLCQRYKPATIPAISSISCESLSIFCTFANAINRAASQHTYVKRSMSDWFHNPLERNVEDLSDLVADYYGDKVLVEFRKLDVGKGVM